LPPTLPSLSAMTSDLSVQLPVNTPTDIGPIDPAAADLLSPRGRAQLTLLGTPPSVTKPPPKGLGFTKPPPKGLGFTYTDSISVALDFFRNFYFGVKTNTKRALINDKTFATGLPEDLAGPADDDVYLADMTNTKKRGGQVLSKLLPPLMQAKNRRSRSSTLVHHGEALQVVRKA